MPCQRSETVMQANISLLVQDQSCSSEWSASLTEGWALCGNQTSKHRRESVQTNAMWSPRAMPELQNLMTHLDVWRKAILSKVRKVMLFLRVVSVRILAGCGVPLSQNRHLWCPQLKKMLKNWERNTQNLRAWKEFVWEEFQLYEHFSRRKAEQWFVHTVGNDFHY